MMRGSSLPRAVWLLGWVSLATDASSEAIYPLLPFFLTTVLGAGALSLGIVEGAAEAVNSLLKIVAGRWSDRSIRRRPLVLVGYAISSAVRPLMSVAGSAGHVFAVRFVDRIGKGIRSAPRDALLATLATSATRGRVFGFHRGMDHAGAILGPILASLFLLWQPGQYRTLFALAVIPAVVAVVLILLVREPPAGERTPATTAAGHLAGTDVSFPRALRTFLVVVALFTIGNSTDAYLLLRLTEAAGGVEMVPLMWAGLHVVKASASFVAPGWSDRIGRRRVIGLGWMVYALVYLGFAVSSSLSALLGWFLLYGLYFGCAEGTEKALVADLAPPSVRGTAFGIYTAVQGLGVLVASLLFGLLWTLGGPRVAFLMGSALAIVATGALFAFVSEPAVVSDAIREPEPPGALDPPHSRTLEPPNL